MNNADIGKGSMIDVFLKEGHKPIKGNPCYCKGPVKDGRLLAIDTNGDDREFYGVDFIYERTASGDHI